MSFLGLTALVFILIVAGTPSMTSANPAISENDIERQVNDLLAKMTLEEKVLQTLAYTPNGVARLGIPNLAAGETLHGVVSDGCTCFPHSIAMGATFDPELLEEEARVIAREARAVGLHQTYSPMLGLARDPRWGRVEESFGEDPYLVARMGVAYINGIQGRGNDRFDKDHIFATPKHFVADGEPWSGANGEGFETSERNLRENHFVPFEAVVKEAGTMSIMPAHHAVNGVPCHVNSWLLQTILRDEWGFKGFVTSDMSDIPKSGTGGGYGGYRYVRGDEESAAASIKAGVDMELVGKVYKLLPKMVREGKVEQAVIDKAAGRVLRAKIILLGLGKPSGEATATSHDATGDAIRNYKGEDDLWAKLIADGKFTTPESARRSDWKQVVNDPAHDALALKCAQKSIVLLKNKGNLLPLDHSKANRVLIVGPIARQPNIGGYSTGHPKFYIDMVEGLRSVAGKDVTVSYCRGCNLPPYPKGWGTPAFVDAGDKRDDKELTAEAIEQAKQADVIVAVVGHTRGHVGENLDRDHFDLIGSQQSLVEAMHATGKPVVVVLNSGAPLSVRWIEQNCPAIVQAFYAGQSSGTAVAQVLFGDVNPSGKLPVSFPRNVGQSPWYYNHPILTGPVNYFGAENDPRMRGGPLFPFGFGLSYTTFKYSDIRLDAATLRAKAPVAISLNITNTGSRAGDEVVQFYIRQDYTSLTRPVKTLVGFKRISLEPGETKEVSFPVGFEQIKFWKDGKWTAEPGEIQLMVGSSSSDIRSKAAVQYAGD